MVRQLVVAAKSYAVGGVCCVRMARAACVRAARGVRIVRVCHAKVVGIELMACARLRGLFRMLWKRHHEFNERQ